MNWWRNPQPLLQNFHGVYLMNHNVFELPFDTRQKAGDQGAGRMSEAAHLGCLDDLHKGAQDLVPSFAHASPGMRESWANANRELGDLAIIGMNAGARFGNNSDAINKYFNGSGGHSEDVAAKADGGFENFLAGRAQVAATHIDTSKNRLNNNYGQG